MTATVGLGDVLIILFECESLDSNLTLSLGTSVWLFLVGSLDSSLTIWVLFGACSIFWPDLKQHCSWNRLLILGDQADLLVWIFHFLSIKFSGWSFSKSNFENLVTLSFSYLLLGLFYKNLCEHKVCECSYQFWFYWIIYNLELLITWNMILYLSYQ